MVKNVGVSQDMQHNQDMKTRRQIPPGHSSITGILPSRFPTGHLPFESKLEMDFLTLLQIDNCIHDVATQPVTLELIVQGQARTYTPDVLVSWHSLMPRPHPQRQVIFEVKPLLVLREKHASLAPKYRAAKLHLASQGIGFRVVTERTIRTVRLTNAELIAPVMLLPQDREMMDRVRALVRRKGPQKLGDIRLRLEAEGAIRGSILEAAYDLIGLRRLLCDLDAPINDETIVNWWADVALEEILGRA